MLYSQSHLAGWKILDEIGTLFGADASFGL